MTSIELLIDDICETFRSQNILSDVEFLCEFPGKKHDLPLRYPMVSVGIEEFKISPIENKNYIYFGEAPSNVTLKLNICVPHSDNGALLYNVLDRIMTVSARLLNKYTVLSINSGETKYSSSIAGLVIPLYIKIDTGHAYGV